MSDSCVLENHTNMTAKEIDASFFRHSLAYTITSRLSESPSLLISGSGSWSQLSLAAENKRNLQLTLRARDRLWARLVGKFTLHQKLSLSREYFYNCKKGTTFELTVSERVSGRLRQVVVHESWTAGGLLRVEVRAHLLFGQNVMHAIVRLHCM